MQSSCCVSVLAPDAITGILFEYSLKRHIKHETCFRDEQWERKKNKQHLLLYKFEDFLSL